MTKNSGGTQLTIDAALRLAANQFQTAGLELPQLDARLLLQNVMRLDHSGLISANDQQLDDDQIAAFNEFIERRLNRQPIHRIVGEKEFWGLRLKTSNAVLDPRADTECLVEAVISGAGVLIFSGLIAYQVQMIQKYPEERAMEAGIALFIAIFNLLTSVLRLFLFFGRD